MSRILALIRHDLSQVHRNVIALVVCFGLAIIPSLYAWFNIAGSWDPYANTGQVRVALANSDEGLTGTLVPFHVNVGERVVNKLTGSDKIGYVITNEEDALEGVRSGAYYAAVVIPSDFTQDLLSVFSVDPIHPRLDYYVNEKRNAIASIVTGKASGSVQSMVDAGFTEAVTEAAADLLEELSGSLDDTSMLALASNLSNSLDRSLGSLRRSADDVEAYRQVASSLRGVMESAANILDTNAASLDVAGTLSGAATDVRAFNDAVSATEDAVSAAATSGEAAAQDLENAIDAAFANADGKASDLADGLAQVNDVARERVASLQDLLARVESLEERVQALSNQVEVGDLSYTREVQLDLSDLKTRINNAISYLNDLIATGEQTKADLQAERADVPARQEELKRLAAQAREGLATARSGFESDLNGSLGSVADVLDTAAGDASDISDRLRGSTGGIKPLLSDASTGIRGLEDSLQAASERLNATADSLEGLRDRLSLATSSDDLDLARTMIGTDPSMLVGFFTAPVELEREAFYPVQNNGSAMAPYYTTMALWVGGTLMCILIYVGVSERERKRVGASPRHAYFARLAFFLMLGACQSTILLLGDLFFLGVQCENPLLFLATGWVASLVFINILYALSTSLGDVGKAIGVLIMVLQVAGSGGTFPVQMLPKLFQSLYPFLPFVYSENAMRAAMFGVYGNDWLRSVLTLAAFLIPSLLLGLILRKPLAPANKWIEEKLEETGLM